MQLLVQIMHFCILIFPIRPFLIFFRPFSIFLCSKYKSKEQNSGHVELILILFFYIIVKSVIFAALNIQNVR